MLRGGSGTFLNTSSEIAREKSESFGFSCFFFVAWQSSSPARVDGFEFDNFSSRFHLHPVGER